MAEVLSQSQIDALLNSMRSGGEEAKAEEKKPEKKYRKYDFTTPRKFTKDRIKMLHGIFENYTRVISSRLNAQLRTTCAIEVESIEEQKFYEFNNALMEGDVLAMVDVTVHPDRAGDDGPDDGQRGGFGTGSPHGLCLHRPGTPAL